MSLVTSRDLRSHRIWRDAPLVGVFRLYGYMNTSEIVRNSVAIGMLSPGQITAGTVQSLATLLISDTSLTIIGFNHVRTARSFRGRNTAIQRLLKSPAEWLLWIDSDMTFRPETFATMWQAAHEAPFPRIVSALAFMFDGNNHSLAPNIFDWNEETQEHDVRNNYPLDDQFWTDATGVAFTLIHRSVFEAVEYPWHQDHVEHPETGKPMGHDISFYYKCRQAGIRVWYCSDAKTGHIKTFEADEAAYMRHLGAKT